MQKVVSKNTCAGEFPRRKIKRSAALFFLVSLFVSPNIVMAAATPRSAGFIGEGSTELKWAFDRDRVKSSLHPVVGTPAFEGVWTRKEAAPLTIVLIDPHPDYDIPEYSAFYRDILPEIEERYVDTGVARIVAIPYYSGGSFGIALWCAEDQKMGWEFNSTAYGDLSYRLHELSWVENDSDVKLLETIAAESGLDQARFAKCLASRRALLPSKGDGSGRLVGITNRLVLHPARTNRLTVSIGKTDNKRFSGRSLDLKMNSSTAVMDWLGTQSSRLTRKD
jgi:hypothetical protein